ncbi:hypothetical protein T484DRAFT_1772211 [Baffinella frigidus]|nr:hypothetical protein T484DRAFT_1772211 [Cryptophyta sp. CCMP2293]
MGEAFVEERRACLEIYLATLAFVEERRACLEIYLATLVADASAAGSAEFRAFIDANRSCNAKLADANRSCNAKLAFAV